ncbi:MAG: exodeoxyribonuclease VII large subunit [Bacteroidia bacterium]|nr:exodeoxyribonuclease VII large subunit [Bacteroidia bacterium]
MNEQLKLSELNGRVKQAVALSFTAPLWVVAEISELKINRNGHCYLVLIEKEEQGDGIVAQAKATIWSYTFRMLQPYFESTTGQPLTEGIKVLVSVSVEFHELYGYSLNIRDIDPTYTLGDMARRRKEIITRLQADGVFEMNKELELPLVPQKIAIVSSETAAGYQDFMDHLTNNDGKYKFYTKLFPAIMQGNQAESSIIEALEQIYGHEDFFDVVVIIRGGGSQADLSCFDNYNLAYFITQLPIPVLTGIGHEKDDSIVDMVAHTRLKTPTAVAEFLVNTLAKFDTTIDELNWHFAQKVDEILLEARSKIEFYTRAIAPILQEKITKTNTKLDQTIYKVDHLIRLFIQSKNYQLERTEEAFLQESKNFSRKQLRILERSTTILSNAVKRISLHHKELIGRKVKQSEQLIKKNLAEQFHFLELASQKAILIDPSKILARGYSITTYKGRALKTIEELKDNELIETRLAIGTIISEVKTISKRK